MPDEGQGLGYLELHLMLVHSCLPWKNQSAIRIEYSGFRVNKPRLDDIESPHDVVRVWLNYRNIC
jgi:hypothetical protein